MKIKKAWLIKTDGTVERVTQQEGIELSFKILYPVIDCSTIEHVGLTRGVDMWLDENGKLEGLEINPVATRIFRKAWPNIDDIVVGNVVVTDNTKDQVFNPEIYK